MGFIELFFKDKKEIESEDIIRFISQKIEENVKLDYKDIRAYDNTDELAAHVSSFANSEGGLIVLGISEDEIKDEKGRTIRIYPKGPTWGEVSLDKEKLENKLAARIAPPIAGLTIKPIRNEKSEVIFLIDIPKSDFAPHMSSDHKYHVRTNFRMRDMEHYQVANLFRINWTMKEKLVEKIYEPLSSVLEKHANQLREYSCPFRHEVEEIMSKTYYKTQIPEELCEKIDFYLDLINELDKKEHYAREATLDIANRNILDYLREKYGLSSAAAVVLDSIKVYTIKKSHVDLGSHHIHKLLLMNVTIQDYMRKTYWRDVCEEICIPYLGQAYDINLREFDELVWEKCLKEASENTKIAEMRKSAEILTQEAWNLIDEITKY